MQKRSRVLRWLCLCQLPIATAQLLSFVLWLRHPGRHFAGPITTAFHILLAVQATTAAIASVRLLRFALDVLSLAPRRLRRRRRRWSLPCLLGAATLLGLTTSALAIAFILRLLPDFREGLGKSLHAASVDGEEEASGRLDDLQAWLGCCGVKGPEDWLGGGNGSRWLATPGSRSLGCGELREVRGESAEAAGRVCAVPASCCPAESAGCTPLMPLLARSSAERDQVRRHFVSLGCAEALERDYLFRFLAPGLALAGMTATGAMVAMWAVMVRRLPGRQEMAAAEKQRQATALVWAWDWSEEGGSPLASSIRSPSTHSTQGDLEGTSGSEPGQTFNSDSGPAPSAQSDQPEASGSDPPVASKSDSSPTQ